MKQTVFFQVLSDETRLRAISLMADEGELCVCELVHALGLSQPKISRHMASMREAGVLVQRRHAQWMFYRIDPALPDWQARAIQAAIDGTRDEAIIRRDKACLKAMKNRPERCSAA
ncbi:MAG TPA: metalloregulator ArsR/SmtB family transcription factor [Rhizobiales bacterium]|nr:metalloregulator ArsR/SmtB family transcription factor [Hyphomicrobiales bacterium]